MSAREYKVPCGSTTGHGMYCCEGMLCSGCAEVKRLRDAAAIAPPVAAGSVDTVEFNDALADYVISRILHKPDTMERRDHLIDRINAWGAQQLEAGRREMFAEVKEENAILAAKVEKAEAELESWVHTNRIDDLQRALVDSEARVKELEEDAMRWRYLRDLDHDLTGTAGQPCVALPNGMNSGYYLTGPEAIYAVDMSMAEAAQK